MKWLFMNFGFVHFLILSRWIFYNTKHKSLKIGETLAPQVNEDIIVVSEAEHTCMISRGIEKFGSSTATVAVLGQFSSGLSARTKFLESIQKTD